MLVLFSFAINSSNLYIGINLPTKSYPLNLIWLKIALSFRINKAKARFNKWRPIRVNVSASGSRICGLSIVHQYIKPADVPPILLVLGDQNVLLIKAI